MQTHYQFRVQQNEYSPLKRVSSPSQADGTDWFRSLRRTITCLMELTSSSGDDEDGVTCQKISHQQQRQNGHLIKCVSTTNTSDKSAGLPLSIQSAPSSQARRTLLRLSRETPVPSYGGFSGFKAWKRTGNTTDKMSVPTKGSDVRVCPHEAPQQRVT